MPEYGGCREYGQFRSDPLCLQMSVFGLDELTAVAESLGWLILHGLAEPRLSKNAAPGYQVFSGPGCRDDRPQVPSVTTPTRMVTVARVITSTCGQLACLIYASSAFALGLTPSRMPVAALCLRLG
jgi:hypothetical protein